MNQYQYTLICTLPLSEGRFVDISDELAITLPCINCLRDHRTVIFKGIGEKGVCTPKVKCSGFIGQILDRNVIRDFNFIKIKYTLRFDYEAFLDKKYGVKTDLHTAKWARIYFTIECMNCEELHTLSSQENLGRPWKAKCQCGKVIYEETENPFQYSFREIK